MIAKVKVVVDLGEGCLEFMGVRTPISFYNLVMAFCREEYVVLKKREDKARIEHGCLYASVNDGADVFELHRNFTCPPLRLSGRPVHFTSGNNATGGYLSPSGGPGQRLVPDCLC